MKTKTNISFMSVVVGVVLIYLAVQLQAVSVELNDIANAFSALGK